MIELLFYSYQIILSFSKIPSLDTADQDVKDELEFAFRSDGRVSNVTRIMSLHPSFLKVCVMLLTLKIMIKKTFHQVFRESHTFLMYGEGPLGTATRQLLAVIVGIFR